MQPADEGETYLGDGVYVSYDGYKIWLRAASVSGDDHIALEPATWSLLVDYVNHTMLRDKHA